jgi:HPt (histidine-containing phosphotransfer) domain-containing protein
MPGINLDTLVNLRDSMSGDLEFIFEVLDSYLENSPKHFVKMTHFIQEKNILSAAKEAHSLKSSSQSLGALNLGALCQKFEDSKNSTDYALLKNIFSLMQEEYQKVQADLNRVKVEWRG